MDEQARARISLEVPGVLRELGEEQERLSPAREGERDERTERVTAARGRGRGEHRHALGAQEISRELGAPLRLEPSLRALLHFADSIARHVGIVVAARRIGDLTA